MARPRLEHRHLAAAYRRDSRRLLVCDPEDPDAVAAWTWGIGRNVLHDALRRGGAEQRALRRLGVDPPSLDDEARERIEELAGLGTLRAAVAAALAELTRDARCGMPRRRMISFSRPSAAA